MAGTQQETEPSRWRLRDLPRGERYVAAALVVLLVTPYLAALGRARDAGWLPSGDAGMIGLFSRDVLHGHPPTLNTPTTAAAFGGGPPAHHPGPIQFYALAVPMEILGSTLGMLAWTVASNALSILVAAWVVFRKLGPAAGLWGAVVLGAIAWSQGPAQLVDPINSDSAAIALVGLAVLAWAVAAGDRRLVPLLVLWSAYYSQVTLGNLLIGVVLTVWGIGAGSARPLAGVLRRRRARSAHHDAHQPDPSWPDLERGPQARTTPPRNRPSPDFRAAALTAAVEPGPASPGLTTTRGLPRHQDLVSAGEPRPPLESAGPRWWPWLGAGGLLALVLWGPVLLDLLTGHPSNVRLIWDYAREGDRETVGFGTGLRLLGHALDPRALVMRNDVGIDDLIGKLSPADIVLSSATGLALLAVVVHWARRVPVLSWLAATTLVLAAAGAVTGAQIRVADAEVRYGFYRWTFILSAMATLAIGAAALRLVAAVTVAPSVVLRSRMQMAGIAVIAVLTVLSSLAAEPKHGREDVLFDLEGAMFDQVLPAVDGEQQVFVVPYGPLAARSIAMPLALELETHGHAVTVAKFEAQNYGAHREAGDRTPDVVLVITGSLGPGTDRPGRVLFDASADPARDQASQDLTDQAMSAPVVVSEKGDDLAVEAGLNPGAFRIWVSALGDEPQDRLANTTALRLFADGYLQSPRLDPDDLATVLATDPASRWGQDTVRVVMVTPSEFTESYGPIA